MKVILSEKQIKRILDTIISEKKEDIDELAETSEGVKEFIKNVKETPGLLKHLHFSSIKDLEDFIRDNGNKDFQELKDDAKKFKQKD